MSRHSYYLDELCRFTNLKQVGIDTNNLSCIIKEPTLYDISNPRQCCDLFIMHSDNDWDLIELKSVGKHKKAENQLRSGLDFIVENFNIESATLHYVAYHKGIYEPVIVDTYLR